MINWHRSMGLRYSRLYECMFDIDAVLYYTRHMTSFLDCDTVIACRIILTHAGIGQKVSCNWFFLWWDDSRKEIADWVDASPSMNWGHWQSKYWINRWQDMILSKMIWQVSVSIIILFMNEPCWRIHFMLTWVIQLIQQILGITHVST